MIKIEENRQKRLTKNYDTYLAENEETLPPDIPDNDTEEDID